MERLGGIMDQVGTVFGAVQAPDEACGQMDKELNALLAVFPGKLLRKLELQDCTSKRWHRYHLDLKLRERQ